MAISDELREKREAIVREHMESENRHEYDATIATFDHPRYELIGTGEGLRRRRGGRALLRGDPDGVPRPAQRADRDPPLRRRGDGRGVDARHPSRPYRGLPPTGGAGSQILAMFVFEEDRLMCERVYFDATTVLRQLGIAHDPRRSPAGSRRCSTTR